MKAKILITGPKVHDVGYRYYLLSQAMSCRIRRFEAYNLEGDKEQEVEALIDGNDNDIKRFIDAIKAKHPALARISSISSSEYAGDVMSIGEYSQFCTTVQMAKAIPVLLNIGSDLIEMKDNLAEMNSNLAEMKDNLTEMKGDLKTVVENTGSIADIRQIQEDIRAIKTRLGMA